MRNVFRPIAIGIVIGAGLFFVPFLFRFILFVLLLFFIIRLIFGWGWRRGWRNRRFYGPPFFYDPYDRNNEEDIVPIDRQWYRPSIQRRGPENNFPVH
jgi:hypothetical protein